MSQHAALVARRTGPRQFDCAHDRCLRATGVAVVREDDEMNVATVLKTKGRLVTTARAETSLKEIAECLAVQKIGAIVIVGDGGRVHGILSERDMVRVIAEKGPAALLLSAADVMTRNVVTCEESHTLDELMELMTTGRFRHVPVVQNGNLVGLISIGDVVKHHLADMALEVTSMRSYLTTG